MIIDLAEHLVRKVDPVKFPERVIMPVVVEVFVTCLEYTPVVRIFLGLERILSEHDAVLILHEEIVRCMRLSSNVVQNCTDLRVHVGKFIEKLAKVAEVVGVPSHVRGDECGLRMPPKKIVALRHQLFEAGKLLRRIAAPRKEPKVEPSLV